MFADEPTTLRIVWLFSMVLGYVPTTDRNRDGPIFPNLTKDLPPIEPDLLWVSDITFITIAARSIYFAVVLDAWSRRVMQ